RFKTIDPERVPSSTTVASISSPSWSCTSPVAGSRNSPSSIVASALPPTAPKAAVAPTAITRPRTTSPAATRRSRVRLPSLAAKSAAKSSSSDSAMARPSIAGNTDRRDLDHAGAATAEGGKMQGRLGKVERDDRMWDPTSTSRLGVTVTPRRPGFDFEGLEHEVPRAWHPDGIGPTAFLEALSAMAPVAEGFFIDDARRLLPRVADGATRAEGSAFLRQEAVHASMHAAFNRLLIRWGVPVEPVAHSVLRWFAIVDWTSSDLRSAVAMAGEHFLGEIGNAILSRPELLDGVDPRIARLFRWHGFEEVEHKAVLFDVFHAARGHGLYTYAVRIAGLWIAVVLLALALPSVSYRILASAGAARDLHAWRGLLRFVF